jgi:hypothetical protein
MDRLSRVISAIEDASGGVLVMQFRALNVVATGDSAVQFSGYEHA